MLLGVDDGRTDSPLITIEQWDAALRRTGFDGLEIAAKDYEGDAQRAAMMVAKAIVEDDTTKDTPVRLLVHEDLMATVGQDYVFQVKSSLSEAGLSVSTESLSSANINFSPDTLYIILDDGANPILKTDSEVLFGNVKNALVDATRVLWVTAQADESAAMNPEKGLVNGVARVVRGENQALRFLTFDIQESIVGPLSATIAQKIKDIVLTGFYGHEAVRSDELEYIFKDGLLRVPRLVPDANMNQCVRASGGEQRIEIQPFHQPGRPLRLQIPASGFLEDLQFVDDLEVSGPLADDELEVQVEACGINFKDVVIALGQVKKPLPLAGEYAGTVVRVPPALESQFRVGDRVCGYGFAAYASRIKVPALIAARIPDDMSFTTAAAVAVAFSTAHLALIDIARLTKGQSVLIHAAAGGVGQAALRIAKHVGADIFATVGSDAKRQLLAEEFGIPDDHIFSSSTGVFRKGIHRLTNGKGVDVVLNSLSGQLLQDSWAAIASFGTFVEIGKTDLHAKSAINLGPFDRHVTFASVDLGLMCLERPQQVSKLLSDVFAKFATGAYTPMNPIKVMPITEIEDAFRLVQARKHIGKLVLEATPTTMVKALSKPSAGDELNLRGDATYVIAGGLGGLGRGVARFLASRGAKHIVLLSRRDLQGEELQKLEADFSQLGAQVVVFA